MKFMNLPIGILLMSLFIVSAVLAGGKGQLETVEKVEIDKYLGKWIEIARYPVRFQKEDCVAATAEYSLMKNGQIRVLNTCWGDFVDGKITGTAKGRAKSVSDSNSKLKVTFFWPFRADYWIVELDENYYYAVVSGPSRKYVWILCREPRMDSELFAMIVERLEARGFDPSKLIVSRAQTGE